MNHEEFYMKCPNHLLTDVAGYCAVCGMFMCESCLSIYEGNKYCTRHYKPIADKIKAEAQSKEVRKKHGRHHLMVHYQNGTKAQGMSRSMNIREIGFFLELEDNKGVTTGETERIKFSEVKYIANVKSYTGKFNANEQFAEYHATGSPVVIRFRDGEILEGTTMHKHIPNEPRFYLIPNDHTTNNINVLIEQSAVDRIFTPEEYDAEKARAQEKRAQHASSNERSGDELHRRGSDAPDKADIVEPELSQEESMGDFYFETHNYPSALEQYAAARSKAPHSVRLRKKVVVAILNIGIQFVKSREYPAALEQMEKALELDPDNPHALKKAKQLRKIIEKTEKRMREYYEEQEARKQNSE